MKCLVTGGAGFIGSNIVDRLLSEGHKVIVIDNESSDAHEQFYWNKKCINYRFDICEYDKLLKVMQGIDYVFHLAAEARIQPAILNPIKAVTTNVVGTCNVLQAARECGVKRVVYSSTSSAYGLKNTPPLVETMPKDCLNPYSVSKTAGEELCQMYSKLFDLETITFRYFNVYGPRQPTKGQYAPVIGLFKKQKLEGKKMTVVGDGEQRRDFTHVSDVVDANLLAAFSSNKDYVGELFNIGTGINHSVLDIVKMLKGDHEFIPPRPAESRVTLADSSKAEKILGWKAKIKLEDYMNEYCDSVSL
jgi:UDP-glucose 4-epimerase